MREAGRGSCCREMFSCVCVCVWVFSLLARSAVPRTLGNYTTTRVQQQGAWPISWRVGLVGRLIRCRGNGRLGSRSLPLLPISLSFSFQRRNDRDARKHHHRLSTNLQKREAAASTTRTILLLSAIVYSYFSPPWLDWSSITRWWRWWAFIHRLYGLCPLSVGATEFRKGPYTLEQTARRIINYTGRRVLCCCSLKTRRKKLGDPQPLSSAEIHTRATHDKQGNTAVAEY